MATTIKRITTAKKKAVADNIGKDYITDPFFIKKREMSLKLIKKVGLPDSFTKKK